MNDIYKVLVSGQLEGVQTNTVFYFSSQAGPTNDPYGVAGDLWSGIEGGTLAFAYVGAMARNWSGIMWRIRRINNGGGPTFIARHPGAGLPLNGYARQCCCVPFVSMLFRKGSKWRSHHFTLPGLWEEGVRPNRPGFIQRISIIALTVSLSTPIVTAVNTYDHVVWDRASASAFPIMRYEVRNSLRVVASRRLNLLSHIV